MTREEAHKVKMEAKRKVRAYWYEREGGETYVAANLGRNHPDYGMSMKEHLVEKAKRNSEKSS